MNTRQKVCKECIFFKNLYFIFTLVKVKRSTLLKICCLLHVRYNTCLLQLLYVPLNALHFLRCPLVFHHWYFLLLLLARVFFLLLLLLLLLPSMLCNLFDVLLFSNGLLGTHDRNIAPCGTICRDAMGAMVF